MEQDVWWFWRGFGILSPADRGRWLHSCWSHSTSLIHVMAAVSILTRMANNIIHSIIGKGIYLYESSDVEILNNTVDFNQQNGVFLSKSANCSVTNNSINSNNDTGIYFNEITDTRITGNRFVAI